MNLVTTPHTPFVYPEEEAGVPAPERPGGELRILSKVNDLVFAKTGWGKIPPGRTLAARWVVFCLLVGSENKPLADCARELGCSRAWLSSIGLRFSEALDMRGEWQRIESRETCRQRALGVHAGTWVASGATERRKLKRQKAAIH